MFVPLYDGNRLRRIRFPAVTMAVIALNVLVWIALSVSGETGAYLSSFEVGYGFIPALANDLAYLPAEYVKVPEPATYLTYAFMHFDVWHLGGNMLFLWVFGDNVEDTFGHLGFTLFYLACAAAGAACHSWLVPDSQAPLIGASGAVSGVVTAYLILYPRVWIWVLALGRIPLYLPAWVVLALWIALQFVMLASGLDDGVSYGAHAGGILAGILLTLLIGLVTGRRVSRVI